MERGRERGRLVGIFMKDGWLCEHGSDIRGDSSCYAHEGIS